MEILRADYILTCDENWNLFKNKAIAFDEKVHEIGDFDFLKSKYSASNAKDLGLHSVILPGFINLHTHLEFCANKNTLKYGDFLPWLRSVISYRDEIMANSSAQKMQETLDEILQSGISTLGVISSNGTDLSPCVKSPLNIIFFNEILGVNPACADTLWADFLARFDQSLKHKNEKFTPSISVHSPYSTHPFLAKKAIDLAKKYDLCVSTHFMESKSERVWLDEGKGDFKDFLSTFNPHVKPLISGSDFVRLFDEVRSVFTHVVWANEDELKSIKAQNASITHCPISNRLLGVGRLDISKIFEKNINFTLGSDGYSSNYSQNIWEELRVALFSHANLDLHFLAKNLIKSLSFNPANALKINKGSLKVSNAADLACYHLPQELKSDEDLELSLILHTKNADHMYINGKAIK